MWGSFTRDEKLLITFLLGLFAAGTLGVACLRQGQEVSVFSSPRAIMDVKGIGPRIFETNAQRIVVR